MAHASGIDSVAPVGPMRVILQQSPASTMAMVAHVAIHYLREAGMRGVDNTSGTGTALPRRRGR